MVTRRPVNSIVRHLHFVKGRETLRKSRFTIYVSVALLTFSFGLMASGVVHRNRVLCRLPAANQNHPQSFIKVGSLLEPEYHIYWFRTQTSSDPEQLTLYGDFRSAQVTNEHFESNASSKAAQLIDRGPKFDEAGHKVGERGVTFFGTKGNVGPVRIFWTEGDTFWSVQAPTIALAREFEDSEIVHSITMSNKRLQRTRR